MAVEDTDDALHALSLGYYYVRQQQDHETEQKFLDIFEAHNDTLDVVPADNPVHAGESTAGTRARDGR